MTDKDYPPTLDYSSPPRDAADPFRAILRCAALVIAIPAFVAGIGGIVFGFVNFAGHGDFEEKVIGGQMLVMGVGCLFLTHFCMRFRR